MRQFARLHHSPAGTFRCRKAEVPGEPECDALYPMPEYVHAIATIAGRLADIDLVFTKLASQLSAEKLSDLAIIPIIFIIQTLVSYVVALVVTKLFRFNKRASNFITAMGVFGNSNSLPISLVISLAQTLKGLHWD